MSEENNTGQSNSISTALSGLSALAPGASSAFGAANFLYQIYKDAKTWRREDTAYRRATKDMDLAGLNTFNAGSVSQAGASQSSALASYMAMKQVEQKDRELDMMESLNHEKVLEMQYGKPAQIAGTKAAAIASKGAKAAKNWLSDKVNAAKNWARNFFKSSAKDEQEGN